MKKIAIIGMGGISAVHVASILSEKLGTISAICDIREDRLEKAAGSIPYETAKYTDWKKMLDETAPDVVHICTPHYLHAEMAISAMEHGADVYLEKPAAMNYDEGLKILDIQKKTGKKVCVSFQNRVIPTNLGAKNIIDSGEMGKFLGCRGFMTWKRCGGYYTESGWRGAWDTEGGGVLMNQSIHTLDLIQYFGGKVVKTEGTASLRTNRGTIEVEDTAEATIYHENGAHSIFYATNSNVLDASVYIEIYLEKGKLMLQDDKLYRNDGEGYKLITDGVNDLYPGKKVWGVGHSMMMKRFYDAIDGGNDYYCTLEDGIQILKVIGDIYRCGSKTLVNKVNP